MVENLIVVDANFVLLPFQFKIDYLYEITASLEGKTIFIVYKQIRDELEAKKLRQPNATKFHMNLKSGLLYLEKNNDKFNILHRQSIKSKEETTDDFLLKTCQELKGKNKKVYLASNDAELRRKARKTGISTIFLRQKKYLSFD
ncbi:MAG: type II toxin-antitoxin system VapC family toxin [Promethearchaeota archaeon]